MSEWPTPPIGTSDEADGGRDDSVPDAITSDTYWPGQYESPGLEPFVSVQFPDRLVPARITWPDGRLVVVPVEAAP